MPRRSMVWASALTMICGTLSGQVVREPDASSVAGVLGGLEAKVYDDFSFSSGGREVLFATVDAAIYQTQGAAEHDDHGEPAVVAEEEPGGCEDESGIAICLQVLDATDQVLCWATRPRSPGWQRDPRLICLLPEAGAKPAAYRLRVAFADHDCADLLYPAPGAGEEVPYLLNVSLRRIAPPGPLAPAIAQSTNKY